MEKLIIKRTGLPPIVFIGEEIGSGSTAGPNSSSRWTTVDIYRTQGGRYIAHVRRLTQWQGESDSREAKSCATAAEVVEYLRGDNISLGYASQEAVEAAAKNDPAFAAAWVEEVE